MTPDEILEISQNAIWLMMKISLPIMLVALFVGLIISLFQALTQMQEMTLSFVPKIVAIFVALALLLPFIGRELGSFTHELADRIAGTAPANIKTPVNESPGPTE